jgi:cysteinyl-tRNA synthetase
MHCGALRVGDDKMSKSLGNFFTIRDALKHYDGEVLRFFLVRTHYRSQIAYSAPLIAEAKTALTRLYTALRDAPPTQGEVDWSEPHAQRFAAAMDEDFNSAGAIAVLFDLASEVNRSRSAELARQLKALGGVLGFLQRDPVEFLQRRVVPASVEVASKAAVSFDATAIHGEESIGTLIEQRTAAKKAKNFAEADRIRAELLAQGIVLEDKPGGQTIWRRQ